MKNTERHWLLLPARLRKWGQALLHQQCWCWGQDIRHIEGNLLLAHGFARTRPPADRKGSPTYAKALDDQRHVNLWGFGLCYSEYEQGSVFLSRYNFMPRFSSQTALSNPVWKSEHLHDFHPPHTSAECAQALDLLCRALRWLSVYETRVLSEQGVDYRRETLRHWSTHLVLPAPEVPAEWTRLSALCRQHAVLCSRGSHGIQRTSIDNCTILSTTRQQSKHTSLL